MNDWVIYQIFVDAFARGSSRRALGRLRGGDLEGVLERLEYIERLGANAIWLTPIFSSPSDHGYNITDYFRLDPRLVPDSTEGAGEALFKSLVDEAHARGLKVLLDLPLNHVGHGYDLDLVPGEHRPRLRPARTRQERGWTRDLKYLDHDHDGTREFLFGVARHWVREYGVDGYRYDYVHGIGDAFWEALYADLRALKPDFFVIGEHWDDIGSPEQNARDIGRRFSGVAGPCFDTLFDFPFQAAVVECLATGDPRHLVRILDLCDSAYPRPACAMLDNHDTARVTDWAEGDPRRIAMTLRLLASRPGPICILYGTETGLRAGRQPKRNVDESSRLPMNWDEADGSLSRTCRRILHARREASASLQQAPAVRAAVGPLFVESRGNPKQPAFVIVLNCSSVAVEAGPLLRPVVEGSFEVEALCGGDVLKVENGRLAAVIPPFGGGFYRL